MGPDFTMARFFGIEDCDCGLCQEPSNSGTTEGKVNMDNFTVDMWEVIDRCGNVLITKQEDYGPYNISRAPGGPLNGLRVRIYDKIARINNLIDESKTPKNESLYDSFLDLANYAIIALMVLEGTWPELEDN
jgi:hypothetical protein